MDIEKSRFIIQNNPFLHDKEVDVLKLYVTFLSLQINNDISESIKKYQSKGEAFYLANQVVYLYCSGGYGKTKLTNNLFEKKLKLTATTRNWKTTLELLKLAET